MVGGVQEAREDRRSSPPRPQPSFLSLELTFLYADSPSPLFQINTVSDALAQAATSYSPTEIAFLKLIVRPLLLSSPSLELHLSSSLPPSHNLLLSLSLSLTNSPALSLADRSHHPLSQVCLLHLHPHRHSTRTRHQEGQEGCLPAVLEQAGREAAREVLWERWGGLAG